MKKKLRNNGLSIAMFLFFAVALVGQTAMGHRVYNQQQQTHHQAEVSLGQYLVSGHFCEALFENWESEFLQMGVYVIVTAFLFQKGSSESNDPDDPEKSERKARQHCDLSKLPLAMRVGGWRRKLYENSLGLSLLALFVLSFVMHAWGGMKAYNEEQQSHGESPVTLLGFLMTANFWFQSFQNWQSEFFSIGMVVVLSIFLRQKNSPESKPLYAAHDETGSG